MKREFLEGLGLNKATIDQIMAEYGSDLQREKAKADLLKSELASVQATLNQRDLADAVSRAVAGKGLKFSSKAAERDFIAGALSQNLQWSDDGRLDGLDEFILNRKEADPGAFAPVKSPPRFISGGDGDGHCPPGNGTPLAEWIAESIGKASAARDQAALGVISNYKGGCGSYGS